MVTLESIAAELGITRMTVSRALRNAPRVSEATRQKVVALAARYHYSPNHVALSFRGNSTKTLGVLFPYCTPPYYATLLDAINAQADAHGLRMEVHFHQWSEQKEATALRDLVSRRVSGLILLPATSQWGRVVEELLPTTSGLPVAVIGMTKPRGLPRQVRGMVGSDLRLGSEQLGRHLLEMGHRSLAMLLTYAQSLPVDPRLKGLRTAVAACPASGASLTELYLPDEKNPLWSRTDQGDNASIVFNMAHCLVEQFMSLKHYPTAVVTMDEITAQVLSRQLHRANIRVPQDISVACYDGSFLSEIGNAPLTCVQQPFDAIARQLMELISASPADVQSKGQPLILLPPKLVSRDSVTRRSDSFVPANAAVV